MEKKQVAYVVDVNMGYGHSRAAHTLRDLSGGNVISANDYENIPQLDVKMWKQSRLLYEFISRCKPVPYIGDALFACMDYFQKIKSFYPRRDLSSPTLQLKQIFRFIENGLGKHLITELKKDPKPFITTFFIPAFFAEYYGYPEEIWCVTTDADISRAWVSFEPKKSRIKYFASNGRVLERLKLYGVPEENIFLSGFPLPKELIGGQDALILKHLLAKRLKKLDPNSYFEQHYREVLNSRLPEFFDIQTKDPFSLTYTIGGAGAQQGIAKELLHSFQSMLFQNELELHLIVGTRKDLHEQLADEILKLGLLDQMNESVFIHSYSDRNGYFDGFSEVLAKTDILYTKPSELSFYTGLGIPIIMAPSIGSQEDFNRIWLQQIGGGIIQNNPSCADEWISDWRNSGGLARMAWSGFLEAPTHGTYRIEECVRGIPTTLEHLPLIA